MAPPSTDVPFCQSLQSSLWDHLIFDIEASGSVPEFDVDVSSCRSQCDSVSSIFTVFEVDGEYLFELDAD